MALTNANRQLLRVVPWTSHSALVFSPWLCTLFSCEAPCNSFHSNTNSHMNALTKALFYLVKLLIRMITCEYDTYHSTLDNLHMFYCIDIYESTCYQEKHCQTAFRSTQKALKRKWADNKTTLRNTTLWYARIPCNLLSMQSTDVLQVISVAATSNSHNNRLWAASPHNMKWHNICPIFPLQWSVSVNVRNVQGWH